MPEDGEHGAAGERPFDSEATYEIRVRGTLDPGWADWFGRLDVLPQAGGETLLVGPVPDQAALHGILSRIRDLGLPLLLVRRRQEQV